MNSSSSRLAVLALVLGLLIGQGSAQLGAQPSVGGGTFIGGSVINPIQFPDGTGTLPAWTFSNDTALGCWRQSANDLRCGGTGGSKSIAFQTASGLLFRVSGSDANWNISTGGNLIAGVDNNNDIGASGATRPRTLFLGTGLNIAGSAGQSVTTTVRASGGAADCTLIFTGGIKTGGTC